MVQAPGPRVEPAEGPLPTAVVGLGFIGRKIVEAVLATPDLSLVAAVDIAPELVGRPLFELVRGAARTLRVEGDLGICLPRLKGGLVLFATTSRFEEQLELIEAAVRAGAHVVSTCEELAFPWLRFEEKADALDALAKRHEVSVLGTGVNPGFAMDRLVATLGAASGSIRRVHVTRRVDLTPCREALLQRAGVGLTEDEFERRSTEGEVGHVGLAESAALCALGLGLDFDEYEEDLVPLVADEDFHRPGAPSLLKGQVVGLHQLVRGFHDGRERVVLELTLELDAESSFDHIDLDADPPLKLRLEGGVASDTAAWAVVNAAPRMAKAERGLLTVLDLPAGR